MQTTTVAVSKSSVWIGRVLSWLIGLFLVSDAVMKIMKPPFVVEATVKAGYSESSIVPIGIALLISVVLYLIPKTSILGAVLVTSYLGGAVATNVHQNGGLGMILFPAIFGVLAWGALWLQDVRLKRLMPVVE